MLRKPMVTVKRQYSKGISMDRNGQEMQKEYPMNIALDSNRYFLSMISAYIQLYIWNQKAFRNWWNFFYYNELNMLLRVLNMNHFSVWIFMTIDASHPV